MRRRLVLLRGPGASGCAIHRKRRWILVCRMGTNRFIETARYRFTSVLAMRPEMLDCRRNSVCYFMIAAVPLDAWHASRPLYPPQIPNCACWRMDQHCNHSCDPGSSSYTVLTLPGRGRIERRKLCALRNRRVRDHRPYLAQVLLKRSWSRISAKLLNPVLVRLGKRGMLCPAVFAGVKKQIRADICA